ncbi:hypothetical protein [Micromonospora chokoriensis]|uniref:Uncharacterized protein n=1 Tax=Micromonospora chokoriensis TaxID=356851 RepID=A0A1C4YP03_9ACTN|nr:hypothetical protein [Micromonospora chokoriensis]SCF22426.1 hypothetical protein GA0070612_5040 [Micromonospora chokoriensis]
MSSQAGERLYRVRWLPGTDILRGSCHCGAERLAEEPIELWEWLLGHPRGHQAAAVPASDPPTRLAMPA